jgi:3-hydroxy-9,10-secoandrosta-1,3,5(10)-triene-9,17-dione monooxygenase
MTVPASQAAELSTIEERREYALAQVQSLLPEVRERAAAVDEERCVADKTIEALLDADLFNVLTPRTFGGAELGIETLVRITADLAGACGSTGWVYGVLAGHSWLLNLFPVEAQKEVFADPRTLTATVFRLSADISEVDGGYRLVNGAGKFCSGIDFASWVIVGSAVQRDASPPEPRFFVVPRADIEIIDDWHTVGMRGTGSRSIRISEAFIPAHRSVSLGDLLAGSSAGARFHEGPLYRMPFQFVAPFSIIGAPLGMARNAVNVTSAMLGSFLDGQGENQVAGRSASLARLGTAAAQADAAFALVLDDARCIDAVRNPESLDENLRLRLPRNWAYAAQTARAAVNSLFEGSGGSSIYAASQLQRIWRDVNSAAQHFAFVWDTAMTDSGRAMLGLPPLGLRPGQRR